MLDGVRKTVDMYLAEADLRMAVGETGVVKLEVVLQLERGLVQWSKGGCYFERRISYRGG